jgi:acyl-coenzyme A thioesterase PaaI-like protein
MRARWLRRLFNVYPPYLGAGVRVRRLDDDYRYARVEMPLRWFNRNYVGTHFGGSLFSMTDPFLMIMLMRNLGPDYLVWNKAASIEFVAPGRGTMVTEFRIDEPMLDLARAATARGDKYLPWFDADVRDGTGAVVARVRHQLYIRRKSGSGREGGRGGPEPPPASPAP